MSSEETELSISREAQIPPELIFKWNASILGYCVRLGGGFLSPFSNYDLIF